MSNTLNKVYLIGRLGCDPITKNTQSGAVIVDFSLAVHYMKDGQEEVTWIPVKVFGVQAESCSKYLKKGRYVHIEGRLDVQNYIDKDDATKKHRDIRVVADKVMFLDSQKDSKNNTIMNNKPYGDRKPYNQNQYNNNGFDQNGNFR